MSTSLFSRRALGWVALGSLALTALPQGALASAPSDQEPVPGVNIGLQQDPGAMVVSGRPGRDGWVRFADLPAGQYQPVLTQVGQITRPFVIVIRAEGREPITSDPIMPVSEEVRSSSRGYHAGLGGRPLVFDVPAGSPPIRISVQVYQPAGAARGR